jgi:HD-GYP domain-containing protein (c-di-GMP phosphodiesterase class II)
MGTEEAIAELRDGAGTQFDVAVVNAFEAVIAERSKMPA